MTSMGLTHLNNEAVSKQKKLCLSRFSASMPWLAVFIALSYSASEFRGLSFQFSNFEIEYAVLSLCLSIPFLIIFFRKGSAFLNERMVLTDYQQMLKQLDQAKQNKDIARIKRTLKIAKQVSTTNHLMSGVMDYYQSVLEKRTVELRKAELRDQLHRELKNYERNCDKRLSAMKSEIPIVKANRHIQASLNFLTRRRAEIVTQWEAAYEKFSWWNKLKYSGGSPDLREMDKVINELERMKIRLAARHDADYDRLDAHFECIKSRSEKRIYKAIAAAEQYIDAIDARESRDSNLLNKALWFSTLSVPVSAWSDLNQAGSVYDALREVNGNFAGMSNTEIWWESLFMSPESLAGLASLTKGAYLEQLVAADSGGQLFEHFNNPDTDIVLDGIAYQIKATDSAAYVNSVDDEIPVIATSEVATATGAIDSGVSNEELTNSVDLALGGTVVDVGDSAVDAVLAGLGGLGFMATLAGINHAVKKHENGGDGVEAMFEGAGVAIEGTARALVGAAELSYKAITSRPSRFVGRQLLKGIKKIDDKLMSEAGNNK